MEIKTNFRSALIFGSLAITNAKIFAQLIFSVYALFHVSFTDGAACGLSSSSNLLIVPNGDALQFVDFSQEYLTT